jgi:hypothetical protein
VKFKVGKYYLVDIRGVWSIFQGNHLQVGKLIIDGGVYGFEFIKNINCTAHTCNTKGKLGHCLYVPPEKILREINEKEVLAWMI